LGEVTTPFQNPPKLNSHNNIRICLIDFDINVTNMVVAETINYIPLRPNLQ